MSDPIFPVLQLARVWNLPAGHQTLYRDDRLTACRWRHTMPEFPDTVVPTNTLVLLNRPVRSWRRHGRKSELATSRPGGLGLITEGSQGSWKFDGEMDVFHFYISNFALSHIAEANGSRPFVELHERLDLRDAILEALASEAAFACSEGKTDQLYASTLGLAVGLRLLRAHSNLSSTSHPHKANGQLASWQLGRVIDFLKARHAEEIPLAELAAIAKLSPFHFARAFKATTGLPPHRYLIHLRMERARELLETTNLPVIEIAAQVGYDDPGYLAQLFRKHFGTTPGAYRRERLS